MEDSLTHIESLDKKKKEILENYRLELLSIIDEVDVKIYASDGLINDTFFKCNKYNTTVRGIVKNLTIKTKRIIKTVG